MTVVSMNYLLETGVHFGHQKRRWNPKMKEYIYTTRDDIYIIDLQKTARCIEKAYEEVSRIANDGGKFLFVGTKKQAQEAAEESANRTDMYFVNERWLGGTLTNFKTIKSRVRRLEEIEKMEQEGTFELLPKKEVIDIKKEYDKLNKYLRGIRNMKKIPDALIIVDPKKEEIAIREARKLNIPVFGIVDTNCDPDMVDFVIPGNDDAVRSVKLIIGVLTNAIAEANDKEVIDYISDEDKAKNNKKVLKTEAKEIVNKVEEKVTEVKETIEKEVKPALEKEVKPALEKEVKEVKKEVKKVVDNSAKTLAELKEMAKEKGVKGYSTMKKADLLEILK